MISLNLPIKLILAILAILLLSEIAARSFFTPPRLISFVAHDFSLGHKGPANAELKVHGNDLRYTADGFRSLPVLSSIPPHLKIAWLGDSMTEAFTIPDRRHFAFLAAEKLHARSVLYAAGDWGTAQEVMAFSQQAPKDRPDIAVINFSSLTDFANNNPSFAGLYQSKVDFLRPYAKVNQESGELEYFYVSNWYHSLRSLSRLFLFYDNARISRALAAPFESKAENCRENPNNLPLSAYFVDDSAEWKESERLTAGLFREFVRVAKDQSVKPLAIYVPSDFELDDKKWNETVKGPMESCFPGRKVDRREIERKFLSATKDAGLESISLFDFFRDQLLRNESIFLADGHFNERGHDLFSTAVVNALQERKR